MNFESFAKPIFRLLHDTCSEPLMYSRQVGKEVIEAFLDLLLQPRLWSVKQLHSDDGPIHRIWAECFEHAIHSARLMKVCQQFASSKSCC